MIWKPIPTRRATFITTRRNAQTVEACRRHLLEWINRHHPHQNHAARRPEGEPRLLDDGTVTSYHYETATRTAKNPTLPAPPSVLRTAESITFRA